jgi:hypothetical protein
VRSWLSHDFFQFLPPGEFNHRFVGVTGLLGQRVLDLFHTVAADETGDQPCMGYWLAWRNVWLVRVGDPNYNLFMGYLNPSLMSVAVLILPDLSSVKSIQRSLSSS